MELETDSWGVKPFAVVDGKLVFITEFDAEKKVEPQSTYSGSQGLMTEQMTVDLSLKTYGNIHDRLHNEDLSPRKIPISIHSKNVSIKMEDSIAESATKAPTSTADEFEYMFVGGEATLRRKNRKI